MKNRLSSFLLILTLLCAILPVPSIFAEGEATDVTIDLIASGALTEIAREGTFTVQDGHVLCPNTKIGDTGFLCAVPLQKGEHVRLEATAIIHEGDAFGVMVAEQDAKTAFDTGWFCLNADIKRKSTRLLGIGGGAASQEIGAFRITLPKPDLTVGVPVTLTLEILPDSTLLLFYNGKEYTNGCVRFDSYAGGFPGIMTYLADVEFFSATLTFIGAPPSAEWAAFLR